MVHDDAALFDGPKKKAADSSLNFPGKTSNYRLIRRYQACPLKTNAKAEYKTP